MDGSGLKCWSCLHQWNSKGLHQLFGPPPPKKKNPTKNQTNKPTKNPNKQTNPTVGEREKGEVERNAEFAL